MNPLTVWGVMCILVGCGFLVSALRIYARRRRFLSRAEPAVGTVTEVRIQGVGRNAMSIPSFEFRTTDGTVRRAESLMGSGFQGFEIGETLPVQYDPADPTKAEVDSFAVLWGLALLRAGFALLFLLMGFIGLML